MSPYEITYPGGSVEHWNEKPGVFYINKLVNYFDKVVWLNPEQSQNWQYSQSTMILRDLVKKYVSNESKRYRISYEKFDLIILKEFYAFK